MSTEADTQEALAVRDGIIIAIGPHKHVHQVVGDNAHLTIDLEGAVVLPGFVESHAHLSFYGELLHPEAIDCGPQHFKTLGTLLQGLASAAKTRSAERWIVAHSYDNVLTSRTPEQVEASLYPSCEELDNAVPRSPLILWHASLHVVFANTRALMVAGLQPGECAFFEAEAFKPLRAAMPPDVPTAGQPSPRSLEEATRRATAAFIKAGITSVHDMLASPKRFAVYNKLLPALPLHLRCYRPFSVKALPSCVGDTARGAVKFIIDGSIQLKTAAVAAPYLGEDNRPGGLGFLKDVNVLKEQVLQAHLRGEQIALHANGERAVELALDALEEALLMHPQEGHRHRIEHAQLATKIQLDRMARLDVVPSFFIGHVTRWGDAHVESFIGLERAARLDPLRSAQDAGLHFALHSDAPVTAVSPLDTMWAAMSRKTHTGKVLGAQERISGTVALKALTIDAAYLGFEEKIRGSLEAGKVADMVVLSADPVQEMTLAVARGDNLRPPVQVLATVIAGVLQHKANGFLPAWRE